MKIPAAKIPAAKIPAAKSRKPRQKGQEIIEFAFVALLFAPLFLGMFVIGMNLIMSIQANNMVRNLGDLYIHGADFSTYPYQQLAQRMGTGLNLQMPSFSGNLQSNTGSTGDGIIWITQVMYVGATTDPNCVAAGNGNCTNHDSFVFMQRIVFGSSSLTGQHASSMGDPSGATISSQGSISNPVTDVKAKLPPGGQSAMVALWQTTANGQAPLTDGQVFYASEGFFQTPSLSLGNNVSQGVSVRSFFRSPIMQTPLRPPRTPESGASLMLAVMSLIFLVPMIGLAVDVGMLYVVKARLQGAVDGASLAAARSLNLGQTTAAQATSAKQNAVNWFYANFPAGNWFTSSTLMDTTDTHAHVYDDPVNPNLRHVDVTASSHVPTLFMNWFGVRFTNIVAYGFASRRDVNAMLVMDRSGSMCHNSSPPCTSSDPTCGALIQASKTFTGQFSAGRDKIGAISFGDNAYLHSVPAITFQTDLGYINSFGTANGELDTIACGGGTATPQAIALAYNELYKINQPGALNVIVVETDGKPNTVTVNFWDGSTSAIAPGSSCRDANNKTKGQGGFATLASLPAWTGGHAMSVGGTGYTSDIPAGIIGGIGGTDTGNTTFLLFNSWTTVKTNDYSETPYYSYPSTSATNGCVMSPPNSSAHNNISDLTWLPTTDVYGSNLINASYNVVTVSGGHVTPINMTQIRNAAFNATDSVASSARTNANLPITIFAVGFTSTVDDTILQRIANDPDWLSSASCVSSGQCVVNSNQPEGTYVFAATTADLIPAFLTLSSQILRLSR